MPKAFWNDFESVVGTYTIGEDFTSATEYICNYMINAVSAVLNYPLWYSIIDVFANATVPTNQLAFAVDDLDKTCHDPTLMGVFTENHDVARLHHLTDDLQHVRNALVFALLSDGIPILYYGAEQAFSGGEDPGNREALWLSGYNTSAPLYQLVKKVNFARNAMVKGATYTYWSPYWTHKTRFIYAEDDVVAVRKGYDKSIVSVITNKASGSDDIGPFEIGDTNFHAQAQIVDVLTCNTKTTGDAGVFDTTVKDSEPQVRRALFVKKNRNGVHANILPRTGLDPDILLQRHAQGNLPQRPDPGRFEQGRAADGWHWFRRIDIFARPARDGEVQQPRAIERYLPGNLNIVKKFIHHT